MKIPKEKMRQILDEALTEVGKDREGQSCIEWHRQSALASDTDFYEYLTARAGLCMVESEARKWLANRK